MTQRLQTSENLNKVRKTKRYSKYLPSLIIIKYALTYFESSHEMFYTKIAWFTRGTQFLNYVEHILLNGTLCYHGNLKKI